MGGMFKQVRKRTGEIVPWDQSRIAAAILKAMNAVGEGGEKDAQRVSDKVVKELLKKFPETHIPGIEEIQDVVETKLILDDYAKTAKAYILYRQNRAELREKRKTIPERVKKLVEESRKYFRNPLSEFVYYRSYSRWIENEGRRETWVESVGRYMDFMRENLGCKLTDAEYEDLRQAVLRQDVMPSMRLMWSAGKAARATNVAGYNCSFIAPEKIQDFAEVMYLSMCGTGVGFSVEQQTVQKLPQIQKQTGKKLPAHVVEDSKEGWADAFALGLRTWFDGKDIEFDYSRLRPAGARLRTMGGKSSGPRPLVELIEFSRKKILGKQGRRLSSLDVHDIICKIGEIVEMGGVRRSALLSLSDLDDQEMRNAKTGQFWLTDGQRHMANNSAAYNVKPAASVFLDEWISLAKSGTGERGIFNRGGLEKQLPARRWKIFKKDAATSGTNPCVTGDTWIMTSEGARRVTSLVEKPFTAVINGAPYVSPTGFFETGEKPVFEIRTQEGFSFKATDNHKVLAVDYRSRKIQRNIWKEIRDLKIGDEVVLHNQSGFSWGGMGAESEGWLLGNLLGDGNIESSGKANLDFWGEQKEKMMAQAVSLVHAAVGGRSDLKGYISKNVFARVQSVNLGLLASSYGLTYGHKLISDKIEQSSSDFYRGFLRGWFDAGGSVQDSQQKGVSIRLTSVSLENLRAAQRMLARLGVIGTIYQNRKPAQRKLLPDGRGGQKEYVCQVCHELVISGDNIRGFLNSISFSDPQKLEKLQLAFKNYNRKLNREKFSSAVVSIDPIGKEKVYDCQVPDANAFDGNGVVLHNCGEIVLKSKEFCNLTEVVARAEDNEASLLRKTKLAAILGTYQSTLTNFPYLSKEWKKNCEEERLLGVSVTGQWDSKSVRDPKILAKMRDVAVETNKTYAAKFGVNQSAAVTCVKPSGTVSQLVDSASGMHPRHAPYYIRRIRISATDSLFQMLKDQKVPYYSEVGQTGDGITTFVLEFPVKAPEGAVFRNDLPAERQLEHWKAVKQNFTEHNPSVTISIGDNEWIGVADWLYENWDIIGGLSFLPRFDHVYALAPYEEITKEQYEKMANGYPEIDFSRILLYEKDDETKGAKELACVGGVCEIV